MCLYVCIYFRLVIWSDLTYIYITYVYSSSPDCNHDSQSLADICHSLHAAYEQWITSSSNSNGCSNTIRSSGGNNTTNVDSQAVVGYEADIKQRLADMYTVTTATTDTGQPFHPYFLYLFASTD